MVSMGLFIFSLLAVIALFTFGSTQSLRILFSQNSQQAIIEFQDVFDAALSNTTRTYHCGCDSPAVAGNRRTCIFNAAQSIVPAPAGTDNPDVATSVNSQSFTLFDFEAEFSQTALDVPVGPEIASAYCQKYTNTANAVDDRPQLGCKRVYRVRFYNRHPENAGAGTRAPNGFLFGGRMQLMVCTGHYRWTGAGFDCGNGAYAAPARCDGVVDDMCDNGFVRIAEVPGIRSVTCGQEEILGDTTTAADNFRLDFTYINSVAEDLNLISVQAGHFEKSYSFSAGFRNLTERGIYFSRPSKTSNCVLNGRAPTACTGIGAGLCDDNRCCSGIIDFAGPTCVAQSACWPAGHVLTANWAQGRFQCCSNQAVLKDIAGVDTYECL